MAVWIESLERFGSALAVAGVGISQIGRHKLFCDSQGENAVLQGGEIIALSLK